MTAVRGGALGTLWADLRTVLVCFTRLPVGYPSPSRPLGPALWAAPVAGVLIGALGGLAFWLALKLGLPIFLAAVLAVALQLLATGAFHEDGLADVADGFGGGRDLERKLDIMRDSRLGTYGALALALLLLLRCGALAGLGAPEPAFWALIAAGAAGRAPLALVMRWLPPARRDGLGAGAGRPPVVAVELALALGTAVLLAVFLPVFGWGKALAALALVALVTLAWVALSRRQIGGYTGDVLGALAVTAEAAVLLAAVANP